MSVVTRLSAEQAWARVNEQVAGWGLGSVEAVRQAVLDGTLEVWDHRLAELDSLLWLLDEPPVTACCVGCLREKLEKEEQ